MLTYAYFSRWLRTWYRSFSSAMVLCLENGGLCRAIVLCVDSGKPGSTVVNTTLLGFAMVTCEHEKLSSKLPAKRL